MTIFYHVSPVKGIKEFKIGDDRPGVFLTPSLAHAYYWITAMERMKTADDVSIYTVYVPYDVDVLYGYDAYVPGNPFAMIPAGNVPIEFSRFDFQVIVTDPSVIRIVKEEVVRPNDIVNLKYRYFTKKNIGSFIESEITIDHNNYVLVNIRNNGVMIDCVYILTSLFNKIMDIYNNTRFTSIAEARQFI